MSKPQYEPGDEAIIRSSSIKITITSEPYNGSVDVRYDDGTLDTVSLSALSDRLNR